MIIKRVELVILSLVSFFLSFFVVTNFIIEIDILKYFFIEMIITVFYYLHELRKNQLFPKNNKDVKKR
jgi:hypothetical protein